MINTYGLSDPIYRLVLNDKQSIKTINEASNIRGQKLGGPSWQTWQWIVSSTWWHDSRPIVPQSDKRRHLFCTLVTVPRTSRVRSVAHMSYNAHVNTGWDKLKGASLHFCLWQANAFIKLYDFLAGINYIKQQVTWCQFYPMCVCGCLCVRHTFCQLAYRSDPSTDFYSW